MDTKRRRAKVIDLPPPAQVSDDPELAVYERALGLRSYSSLETQTILNVGETRLSQLVAAGELRPHTNGSRAWSFFGPEIARYLRARCRQQPAPSPAPDKQETETKRRRGRPRKGEVRRIG
jgi:hypothetical protein